jgi:hypothetical protein
LGAHLAEQVRPLRGSDARQNGRLRSQTVEWMAEITKRQNDRLPLPS